MTNRNDTLLGVCAAIGDDFGFDPFWLRLALAFGLLVSLEKVLAAYAVAGVIVFASRKLFPQPRPQADVVPLDAPALPAQDVDAPVPLRQAA